MCHFQVQNIHTSLYMCVVCMCWCVYVRLSRGLQGIHSYFRMGKWAFCVPLMGVPLVVTPSFVSLWVDDNMSKFSRHKNFCQLLFFVDDVVMSKCPNVSTWIFFSFLWTPHADNERWRHIQHKYHAYTNDVMFRHYDVMSPQKNCDFFSEGINWSLFCSAKGKVQNEWYTKGGLLRYFSLFLFLLVNKKETLFLSIFLTTAFAITIQNQYSFVFSFLLNWKCWKNEEL